MENFIAVTGIIAKTPETKTSQKGASYTRARFVHDQGSYDKNTQTWTPAKPPPPGTRCMRRQAWVRASPL